MHLIKKLDAIVPTVGETRFPVLEADDGEIIQGGSFP